MATFSNPDQWESDEDIEALVRRLEAGEFRGIVILSDSLGESYSALDAAPGHSVSMYRHVTGKRETWSIDQVADWLRDGEFFIGGSEGEARLEAAQRAELEMMESGERTGPFTDVIVRLASDRGVELDEEATYKLRCMDEDDLLDMISRMSSDTAYRLEDMIPDRQASYLN